jgi:diguanylate cyclase (GGDEF)-like protein/PAS domain S-box-containing protein
MHVELKSEEATVPETELKGTILLIDDDEVDRMACKRMLSKHRFTHFRIIESELGADGIRAVREEQPDLVLLDYRLPDVDGIDVLRSISSWDEEGPSVVMMTGAREIEIAVEAMKLGARDYIVKDPEENYLALLPEIFERIIHERLLKLQKQQAEEALRMANDMLEQRVIERTTELAQANLALAHEIESRKQIADVLFAERERAMITLASIADAVFVTDNSGKILQLNPAAERLCGMKSEDLIGQTLCESLTFLTEGARRILKNPRSLPGVNHDAEPVILVKPDQQELTVSASGGTIRDSTGKAIGVVTVLRDITQDRMRARRIMHQATHDALTDLPNRILFADRLSQYIGHADRNEEKLAVVFLDLDGFKQVNDTFGHHIGDNLLQSVAERLKNCVREGDSLARLAGDEFTMVVSGRSAEQGVNILADKVIRELTAPFNIAGNHIKIGTSLGISIFPDDGDTVSELMEKADAAMYQAKVDGGSAFRYYSTRLLN